MKLQKRDYQHRAVRELLRLLQEHGRVLAVSPTGSGKTVIGAEIIRRLRGKRVLWLAHRFELLEQAVAQLVAAGIPRKDIGILSGSHTENENARILVASVAMFRSRLVPKVDLFVADEAHHVTAESYQDIIQTQPKVPLLGLTATPWRLDGEPLGAVFRFLYVVAEAAELMADGFIMKPHFYACIDQAGARALTRGLSAAGGDWSKRKLEGRMRRAKLMGDIVREWLRLGKGLPTLLFATTVDHAEDIRKRFVAAGVTCEVVSWETAREEREAIVARLASGETKIVCNVQVFTEGLDCPPVKCIVIARPTKSITLYRQMIGRGSRVDRGRRPIVLDHAGNVWRHGLPESPVEWSLSSRPKHNGVAPTKKCPACETEIPASARECPNCGAAQSLSEHEEEDAARRLALVKATEAEYRRRESVLRQIAKARGLGRDWVQRALSEICAR